MRKTHNSGPRRDRNRLRTNRDDKGFTLIELLIVVAIVGILAALAVAGLLRARMGANEASAIGSLRAINSAQQAYASSCGHGFYASGLPILLSSPSGSAPYISPDLGLSPMVTKSGYSITVARGTDATSAIDNGCNPLGLAADIVSAYYATANPESMLTGSRHFWTSTPGTIYFDRDNPIAHTEGMTPPAATPLEAP